MITKEKCVPGTVVIVNDRPLKWNLGCNDNGLSCFPDTDSWKFIEMLPGVGLEILKGPHKSKQGGGVQVHFRIVGDDTLVFGAHWVCFKHKVDEVGN